MNLQESELKEKCRNQDISLDIYIVRLENTPLHICLTIMKDVLKYIPILSLYPCPIESFVKLLNLRFSKYLHMITEKYKCKP